MMDLYLLWIYLSSKQFSNESILSNLFALKSSMKLILCMKRKLNFDSQKLHFELMMLLI